MPPVAPATGTAASDRYDGIRSEDWQTEVNDPLSHDSGDQMQFSGDGLNTGVRVLSTLSRINLRPSFTADSKVYLKQAMGAWIFESMNISLV
jgi:hypothetical protein